MPSPKHRLQLFQPLHGSTRLKVPTPLVTPVPFDRCPSCNSGRSKVTRGDITFECGMVQTLTDTEEFAVSASCPYAMAAVHELRTRKMGRQGVPPTLVTFEPEGFSLGDMVEWVSQSAGRTTRKVGRVVALVPPHARPEDFIPDGMRRNSTNGYGRARDHQTYLIKVNGKGSMVFWPRVHMLSLVPLTRHSRRSKKQ